MTVQSAAARTVLLAGLAAFLPLAGASATSEALIHSFQYGDGHHDGFNPQAGLIVGPGGVLYGTTLSGGTGAACTDGCGTVFALVPPPAGGTAWTEHVLHDFQAGSDGSEPYAGLYQDAAGALYGTTEEGGTGFGTVFKLTPPAAGGSAWSEKVLYRFKGGTDASVPFAGLMADSSGALYGATGQGGSAGCGGVGCGAVFRLSLPAGKSSWVEEVLYRFKAGTDGWGSYSTLVADASGALYGTTVLGGAGFGTVFKLTPPTAGSAWSEQLLHRFHGGSDGAQPFAGLIADPAGNLYGTTAEGGAGCALPGCGIVFRLAPPAGGTGAWAYRILHGFDGADGNTPYGGLYRDASGALYATTSGGGSFTGGTAVKLTPTATGWSRSILHQFGTGHDASGPTAGLVADSSGTLYGTGFTGGNGLGGTCGCGAVFKLAP